MIEQKGIFDDLINTSLEKIITDVLGDNSIFLSFKKAKSLFLSKETFLETITSTWNNTNGDVTEGSKSSIFDLINIIKDSDNFAQGVLLIKKFFTLDSFTSLISKIWDVVGEEELITSIKTPVKTNGTTFEQLLNNSNIFNSFNQTKSIFKNKEGFLETMKVVWNSTKYTEMGGDATVNDFVDIIKSSTSFSEAIQLLKKTFSLDGFLALLSQIWDLISGGIIDDGGETGGKIGTYSLNKVFSESDVNFKICSLAVSKDGLLIGTYHYKTRQNTKVYLNNKQIYYGNEETLGTPICKDDIWYYCVEKGSNILKYQNGSISKTIRSPDDYATRGIVWNDIPYVIYAGNYGYCMYDATNGQKGFCFKTVHGIPTGLIKDNNNKLWTCGIDGPNPGIENEDGDFIACQVYDLAYYNNKIYVGGKDGKLYYIKNNELVEFYNTGYKVSRLLVFDGLLWFTTMDYDKLYVTNGVETKLVKEFIDEATSSGGAIFGCVLACDTNNIYWGRTKVGQTEVYKVVKSGSDEGTPPTDPTDPNTGELKPYNDPNLTPVPQNELENANQLKDFGLVEAWYYQNPTDMFLYGGRPSPDGKYIQMAYQPKSNNGWKFGDCFPTVDCCVKYKNNTEYRAKHKDRTGCTW